MSRCMPMTMIFSLLLASAGTGAQAGWEYLYSEVGNDNALLDISMPDERTACAVGVHKPGGANSEPLVICTSDGGASWRQARLAGLMTVPTSVHLVDARTGFLTTLELEGFLVLAKVYRTDDGGSSWTAQALPGQPQGLLSDTFFLDADTGFTAGSAGVFLTADGGTTWQAGSLPDLGADRYVEGIFFVDAGNGWAVGGMPAEDPMPACCGFVLRTVDGGRTWQVAEDGLAGALRRVWFAGSQAGWAVGGGEAGLILHTGDGGASWSPQAVPAGAWGAADYVADVAFTDSETGWAVGNIGQGSPMVLATGDGGQSWAVDATYDQAFDGLSGFEAFARYSVLIATSFPLEGRGMVCGTNAVIVGLAGEGFCADADDDGHRDAACGGDDCDDANPYVSPAAEEVCNGLDENCDGVADETFDLMRDPRNCGSCGFNCQPAQVCWDGSCVMDCPAELTRCGQECVDPATDPDHCGGCDQACAFEHAEGDCQAGACVMGACHAGWFDLDGIPDNGCEYACASGCQEQPDGGSQDGGSQDGGEDLGEIGRSGGCGHAPAGGLGMMVLMWLAWLSSITRRRLR